jgi:hypothetical protein
LLDANSGGPGAEDSASALISIVILESNECNTPASKKGGDAKQKGLILRQYLFDRPNEKK